MSFMYLSGSSSDLNETEDSQGQAFLYDRGMSQDAEVGVKWKVQRGWRASQARTLGCLWLP
jgi:hypothetical protein